MNGNLDEYLNNISDFLEIENKIVTYKWICKALKVHTNTAKQLLYAFSKRPEFDNKLLVTYLVAGEKDNEVGTICQLISQKNLENAKQKFKHVSSTHVFSIQKGQTANGADLYNAENTYKLNSEDLRFSSIRPNEEIKRREANGTIVTDVKPNVPPNKVNSQFGSSECVTKGRIESSKTETGSNNCDGSKELSKKKTLSGKASPAKNNVKKTAPNKEDNGIAGLFKKQGDRKKEKPSPEKPSAEHQDTANVETKTLAKASQRKNDEKQKSQIKKKRKKPKDSVESASKKMKRIKVASDSESSDHGSDADARYPSPEPECEPAASINIDDSGDEEEIIPSTPIEKCRKRVRKMVDRVYKDEDGFVHTKKDFVMESCSEEEKDDLPNKKAESEVLVEKEAISVNDSKKSNSSVGADKGEKQMAKVGPTKMMAKGIKLAKGKTSASTSSKQPSIRCFFKSQQS